MIHITPSKLLLFFAVVLLIGVGTITYMVSQTAPFSIPGGNTNGTITLQPLELKTFASEEEFKQYLEESSNLATYGGFGGGVMVQRAMEDFAVDSDVSLGAPNRAVAEGVEQGSSGGPERIGTTNVQVSGIDEPDVLKTDGKTLYYSPTMRYYYARPMIEPVMIDGDSRIGIMPPQQNEQALKIVTAFPPEQLAELGSIKEIGNLLLHQNRLMVFTFDRILGYDVTNPAEPQSSWTLKFGENTSLVQARLNNGKLYVVTQHYLSRNQPCPIIPLADSPKGQITIPCTEIYHPISPTPVDVTYTAMVINAATGEVADTVSFVGAGAASVIYMSPEALYTTYAFRTDELTFIYNFFRQEMTDLIPADVMQRLEKLSSYDISSQSKLAELQVIMEDFYSSLSNDEKLRIENESTNRIKGYTEAHQRELERTGIVKIGLEDFAIAATSDVPGTPLNQFSLDEYQGHLRIATTVGGSWFFGSQSSSVSDVLVLDENLQLTGTVQDLGRGERIFSARFIEDKGYVVTFRQIDPFYVIDLSNPRKPQLRGELKIPGFSSYLHPINKDKIIGVGQEDSQVKISLFDVSNPADPREVSKYNLNEYWSGVLETHHAFLLDDKHGVFFMPGSQGGYIFSYANDQLSLKRAVSDIQAQRAVYLDDSLYIVGDDKIIVLNENNWEQVSELEFE